MIDVPEIADTFPGLAINDSAIVALTVDDKAELVWGDEALTGAALARQVHAGHAVVCSDGRAGRVTATILDPAGQLQQLAVRLSGLWSRTVIIPAGWVQAVDRTGVRLAVARQGLRQLPAYRSDSEIAVTGQAALQGAEIIHGSDGGDVTVTACDGLATLSGHVGTATEKLRAARALGRVPGVVAVQNDLVADDDLVNLVAQALAGDERTRHDTIFVAASHGVIILSGSGHSALARAAAGECAARVSSVRGISNYIEAPGTVIDEMEQRVVQPRVGQEVFASDMSLGRVERVAINPDNRRVVAIVVHGQFPDRERTTSRMRSYETPKQERHVVVPIAKVAYVTTSEVQLNMSGIVAARCADFVPNAFTLPDRAWRPPYPFARSDCLWPRK